MKIPSGHYRIVSLTLRCKRMITGQQQKRRHRKMQPAPIDTRATSP
ncbi:MAG: hypothetical protein ABSG47_17120 [Terracidiphilus sp.]